jgi:UDP-N-acetylmuramate dehydrogenase
MAKPTSTVKLASLNWPHIAGPVFADQPLAPLTTWKIGGPGQYVATAAGVEEVYRLMALAQDRGWPLWFLGRGSNILIDDAGLPGITLHLARKVSLPRLARAAADLGFAGFEFLAGIPGTVGAAVRLNAGADGQNLAALLNRVWVVTPQLQLREFQAAELGLGYRSSLLLNFPHWLVAEAEFILTTPAPPETIKQRLHDLQATRRARQPANYRNCGSVFKNPAGTPGAGFLIDQSGLKGRRVGEAQVSRKHANFILNQGRATAAQVKALISEIQEQVWRRQGVVLEREVIFLPDDLLK